MILLFYKTQFMVEHQSHNFFRKRKYVHFMAIATPNMYNKTFADILNADIYNDTYTKTEIDSTPSAYAHSIDLHNDFIAKLKLTLY